MAYATDSVEKWRRKTEIEEFSLFGHSMGGYLAFMYAERFPSSVNHLILASPAGIPAYPAVRDPPIEEDEWLKRKKQDLEEGRRNRTTFDRGGNSRSRLRLMLGALFCCTPILLLPAFCYASFSCFRNRKPEDEADNPVAPLTKMTKLVKSPALRWPGLRYFYMYQYKDNGQWLASRRKHLASYIHHMVDCNGQHSFGEYFYHHLMTSFSYGTFWAMEGNNLGGNCTEIPFENGEQPDPSSLDTKSPYSTGRIQDFLRTYIIITK